MNVPLEFKEMVRSFDQDFFYEGPFTATGLIEYGLRTIQPSGYPTIRHFIDQLLNKGYDENELLDMWRSLPSDIYFAEAGKLVEFLKELRTRISSA